MLLVALLAVTSARWTAERVLPGYMEGTATVTAAVLRALGEDAGARGTTVASDRMSIAIMRGCDAVEPSVLYVAAVLALPVALRRRWIGLGVGLVALVLLNQGRIVSLYYIGVHWPGAFETVHVDVWQPLFILLTFGGWILWAAWATRRAAPGPPGPRHG
ncbi:MAG: hypothetical protein KF817_07415 [Phycisphaeraceae bacterium]|nr:hypothetical protein [Phycisphaeraceae bacterium]